VQIDTQSQYFFRASREYHLWCNEVTARPSLFTSATSNIQHRINRAIPEKFHKIVTKAVKETTSAVITGSAAFTRSKPKYNELQEAEQAVRSRIDFYANSSATEGAITGFGGFISGLADFPLWLSLKMKMLFEIANIYGFPIDDYRERLYILHIFQLTFCAPATRLKLFEKMKKWQENSETLPVLYKEFDWKTFQLEYRDHIDLAKLIQLIPGFGAIAGAIVNHKYTLRLGENSIQCYRMRFPEFNNEA
jgi:hypothetical protein